MIRNGQGPQEKPLLLVGNGRLARHFQFYFQKLQIPFVTWQRHSPISVIEAAANCSRVLLAISDQALPEFATTLQQSGPWPLVHFSGALNVDGCNSAHPLMSFGGELYPEEFYRQIHFVVTGAQDLRELIPNLPNSFSVLEAQDKARYHALCVLGGNFPVLLWHKMETDLRKLGIPQDAIRSYIQRVCANYLNWGEEALTGPLVRGDVTTIEKNLEALKSDPWHDVYQSFREAHQ